MSGHKMMLVDRNSQSEQDKDMFECIVATAQTMQAIGRELNMSVGDSIACTLAAIGWVSEKYDIRDSVADTMEQWVKLLRSKEKKISFKYNEAGHA